MFRVLLRELYSYLGGIYVQPLHSLLQPVAMGLFDLEPSLKSSSVLDEEDEDNIDLTLSSLIFFLTCACVSGSDSYVLEFESEEYRVRLSLHLLVSSISACMSHFIFRCSFSRSYLL